MMIFENQQIFTQSPHLHGTLQVYYIFRGNMTIRIKSLLKYFFTLFILPHPLKFSLLCSAVRNVGQMIRMHSLISVQPISAVEF